MSAPLIYFAYGSNLSFARLYARCPSIENLGIGRLVDHTLHFTKPGGDGSGKCGIEKRPGDEVLGVLYQMAYEEKPILDRIEGLGHDYQVEDVIIETDRGEVDCFTYYPTRNDAAMPPWDWYKAFVYQGARENGFPEAYLRRIEAVEHLIDPDAVRRAMNFASLHG